MATITGRYMAGEYCLILQADAGGAVVFLERSESGVYTITDTFWTWEDAVTALKWFDDRCNALAEDESSGP